MIKILFICHGNICRSPMAEFIMKKLVRDAGREEEFRIESAATSYEEIGNPVYPPARRELAAHGISCSGKTARHLEKEDYKAFDYLIGMEKINLRNMERICGGDPEGKMYRMRDFTDHPGEIDDPWYTGRFAEVYEQILEGCRGLLARCGKKKPTPGDEKLAFLFDLDGTLLNTLEDIANAMNYALCSLGLPPWETEKYRYMVGNGAKVLAERATGDHPEMADQVLKNYQHQYETHLRVKTRPYEGMTEVLRKLATGGAALCVLSNKPDADTRRLVEECFPDISFAHVQGQLPDVPRKPDPTAALAIAKDIGIPPERFVYVGDSGVDMVCAGRAGMRAAGALWGFRTREELMENGAEWLIRHPGDLPDIAERMRKAGMSHNSQNLIKPCLFQNLTDNLIDF